MPFRSSSQRRWMHSQKPALAARWEKETPSGSALPEHAPKRPGKVKKADFPNAAGPEDWDSTGVSPWKQGEPKHSKDKLDEKKEKTSQGDDPWGGDGTKIMPYLRSIHKMGHIKRADDATEWDRSPGRDAEEEVAQLMAGMPRGVGKTLTPAEARMLFVDIPKHRLQVIQERLIEEALMRKALGKIGHVKVAISPELLDRARDKAMARGSEAAYFADRGNDPTGEHARTKAKSYAQMDRFNEAAKHKRRVQDAVKRHAEQKAEDAAEQVAEAARPKVKAPPLKRVGKALKKWGPAAGAVAALGGALYLRHHLHKKMKEKQKEKTAQGDFEYADTGPSSSADLKGPTLWKPKKKWAAGLDQEYPQVEDGEKGYDPPVGLHKPPERTKRASIVHMPEQQCVAFYDELAKLGGLTDTYMKKEAIDPLTAAIVGTASHVGMNRLVKATHNTGIARGIRAGGLSRGIRGALEGKAQGLGSRMAETWVGPELIAPEHVGRVVGSHLRDLPTGQRYRALKKLRKTVAMSPSMRQTPIMEDVVGGVNRALAKPLPTPGLVQKPSFLQRVLPGASMAAVAPFEPGAVVHAGVNRARLAVAGSAPGMRFMRDQGKEGLLHGAPSRTHEALMDTFVSPAALDTRRLGHTIAETAKTAPDEVRRIRGALHSVVGNKKVREYAQSAQQHASELMGGAKPPIPAPITPPVSPSTYGLPRGVRIM